MRVRLLGTTEVAGEAPLGRRDRVVLAALAVAGPDTLSNDQLAVILWGDDVPASAAKVVQGAVVRLRRLLGRDHIETTPAGYRLVRDGLEVDADEFVALVARAREQLIAGDGRRAVVVYEQALSLWRGAPLTELGDWPEAQAEAARLGEIHDAAEEELVEAQLLAGRANDAVAAARRLLSAGTFREHRWALYARSLYATGRQREALDVLRRAQLTLREELGLDPGPELSALEHGVLTQDPSLTSPVMPSEASDVCPYPGLRAFGAEQSDLFVGREAEVDQCLRRLQEDSLLVVLGASGSGKSSLVRAGVVPALNRSGRETAVLTPGAAPEASLAAALAVASQDAVVVIDQLEEAFAGRDRASVVAFLGDMTRLLDAGRTVVVTVRADQVTALSHDPTFAQRAERCVLLLAPMTEEALRRAVEEPARRSELRLEPGLVDLLMREVRGEPGALPLLGHALAETWARREGNVLTVEGYRASGGINGAVAQSAERLYASLDTQGRHTLRSVLNRLVVITPGGDPVPARVPDRVFTASTGAARALSALVAARLVTADADSVVVAHECLSRAWPRFSAWLEEDASGQRIATHLQIAADAWETAEKPDDELYRGARLHAAMEWRDHSEPLLSAVETQFLDASLAHEHDEQRARARQLQEQTRMNRQLRWALAAVVVLLVLALTGGTMAALSSRHAARDATAAERSAADSLAGRLASASQSEPRLDTSLLLARQAIATSDRSSLRGTLLDLLVEHNVLTSKTVGGVIPGREIDLPVSADGSRALIQTDFGNDEGGESLLLVDPATADVVAVLARSNGDYSRLPWPSGFVDHDRTAVFVRDAPHHAPTRRELVFVNAQTGAPRGEPQPIPGSVTGDYFGLDRIRITPDGRTLTSVVDRSVRIWHRARRVWRGPLTIPIPDFPADVPGQSYADGTRFSADSRYAAFVIEYVGRAPVGPPRVGYVLDLHTGEFVGRPIRLPADLAFAPVGASIAIAQQDGDVVIRPLGPGPDPVVIPGGEPKALAFSDSGDRLAIGYQDGSAAVYALNPLRRLLLVPPTGVAIFDVALPSGESRLVTLDFESRFTTFSLTGASRVIATAPTDPIDHVAVGPPGTVVAAGFYDGRVALFDQTTLKRVRDMWLGPYKTPDGTFDPPLHRRVTALAVTPDGTAVVAADRVGHLRMWSTANGQLLWARDDVPTSWLAISPDGRYLATSEFTQDIQGDPDAAHPDWSPVTTTLRVWDLRHPGELLFTDSLDDFADPDGHTPKPRAITFSPDSSMLAAGWFGPTDLLVVYDVHTGRRVLTRVGPRDDDASVAALAFTPNSRTLLVEDHDGSVVVRDPRTGNGSSVARTSYSWYSSLAYSADGRMLFALPSTTSSQARLSIFDARTHAPIVSDLPFSQTDGDTSLAPTADNRLFIGTADGLARLDLDPARWEQAACDLAGRTLTKSEWSAYFGGAAYRPACS